MDIIDIKNILENSKKLLEELKIALNIESKNARIKELETKSGEANFWDDTDNSQKVLKEIKDLKQAISLYNKVYELYEEEKTMYELYMEENDAELLRELENEIGTLEEECEKLKISSLLSGEYDLCPKGGI